MEVKSLREGIRRRPTGLHTQESLKNTIVEVNI